MSAAGPSAALEALRREPAFAALQDVSARLGRDPLQVQGPGGNTSLKRGDTMWIKASGTWLADAAERDVMVPVDLARFRAAIDRGDAQAEQAAAFVPRVANPHGLRPSIETAVHAVLPDAVVLHTHCVATIAVALRADAEAVVAESLAGMDPVFVPYVQPGLQLARAIAERIAPQSQVVVLGNHGLIATGADCAEAETRLRSVAERLDRAPAPGCEPLPELTGRLAGSDYTPAGSPRLHALARTPERLERLAVGSFYPDHVVFLGPNLDLADDGESATAAAARIAETKGRRPALLLFPGLGAAIRADASPSTAALAACLGEVAARVPADAPMNPLRRDQEAALLGWEAEAYRQRLDGMRAT